MRADAAARGAAVVPSVAGVSFACSAIVVGAVAVRQSRRCQGGRTCLRAKKRTVKNKNKKKSSTGPKLLKSGYWQEGDEEEDIDIFEWISAEELLDEPPASLSGLRELAAFSKYEGLQTYPLVVPEYRSPEKRTQLKKGIKRPPPVDQGLAQRFRADVAEAMERHGPGPQALEDADIITSLNSLKTLLAFVDGRLTEDMRAKGMHTGRRRDPELVDMLRIARMPEAPHAVVLATVWNWTPENTTTSTGRHNLRSYDVAFEQAATGRQLLNGPPSIRENSGALHYRLVEFKCGGLRMVVRVPLVATVPSVDAPHLEGRAVELHSVNRRDAGDLWGRWLPSRYTEMLLGDVGMVVRGILDRGVLLELQELTREDLRLDRPDLAEDSERLLGRLMGLLRRVCEVAKSPGCQDRPLYLQYSDAELRVISPIFDDDEGSEAYTGMDSDDHLLSMSSTVGAF